MRVDAGAGRGEDAESVDRAALLAVEAGYVPSVDYVCGLPGETEETALSPNRAVFR